MPLLRRRKIKHVDFLHSFLAGFFIFSVMLNLYFLVINTGRRQVTRVVDGDSFEIKDGRRIRLLGVDAPELESCMGIQAKEILEVMIEGKIVKLKDIVKDDYGRSLANVFTGSTFVNKEMIERGLGRYVSGENQYHSEMRKAYLKAKENGEGIFSPLCRRIDPETDGCLIKANIRHGDKTYHLPECRNYDQVIVDTSYGDKWYCTEDEAIEEGFMKAGGCR